MPVLLAAAIAAGCGDSAEVKAAKAAQKAEAERLQQLTARIEQRHSTDCDNQFKNLHAAETAEAMGKALRNPEMWDNARTIKAFAQGRYDKCLEDSAATKDAELAAVKDWGQNREAVLARAAAMVTSKDWRGLKSLVSRYEVNGAPQIEALRVTAKKLEDDHDAEFAAQMEVDQFRLRSRQLNVYQVLADLALTAPAGMEAPPQVEPAARCLVAADKVQAAELKVREENGGVPPRARTVPDLYEAAEGACVKEAEAVCAGPGAPASCAAPRDEPFVVLVQASLVSDDDWNACGASGSCNAILGLADQFCSAYLDHVRDFRGAALQQVYAASQVRGKAAAGGQASSDVLGQMSIVGRQVGANLGKTMWRDPLDPKATFKTCDTALRRHPATPRLLAALLPKAAAPAASSPLK